MQESSSTPSGRALSRHLLKASILLALVLAGSLLLTVAALAQQSARYDLACWSVTTGGGGERTSASFRLKDALGQNAMAEYPSSAELPKSANFMVRTGVVQSLDFLATTPPPILTPTPPPSGTLSVHLPLINSFVAIQRTCPQ